jgi:hypothetical protein
MTGNQKSPLGSVAGTEVTASRRSKMLLGNGNGYGLSVTRHAGIWLKNSRLMKNVRRRANPRSSPKFVLTYLYG